MQHEEIQQHLRLAEMAGIKLSLRTDDANNAFGVASAGLYTEQGTNSGRWTPFDDLEQAYLILSRFCEIHDAGNQLVTWTLDREVLEDQFPTFIFHIEAHAQTSGLICADGSSPSIAICRGLLGIDEVMPKRKPFEPIVRET